MAFQEAKASPMIIRPLDPDRAGWFLPFSRTVSSPEMLASTEGNKASFGWQGYPSAPAPVRNSSVMEIDIGERSGSVKRGDRERGKPQRTQRGLEPRGEKRGAGGAN